MSRLDSVIRRLQAQRECLDYAVLRIHSLSGVVFELGLGNGRTYDHLREQAKDRDIYVFDRRVAAHPDCIPEQRFLILGSFQQTLPAVVDRFGGRCVLVHCDIGSGVEEQDAQLAGFLGRVLKPLLCDGALIVSDQLIEVPGSYELPLPSGIAKGRYFIREFRQG